MLKFGTLRGGIPTLTLVGLRLTLILTTLSGRSATSLEVRVAPERVEMCAYGNQTYPVGERFRPDQCTVCHCSRHGGARPLCTIQDCLWDPHCLRRHRRPGECCGSCLEQGCLHAADGKVYPLGATITETNCESCVCPRDGGPTVCTQKAICPEVHCVDPVTDPDTCCRKCINGNNCWLGKRIIQVGVVVKVGRCRECQCPDVGSLPHWRKATGSHAICADKGQPC